MGSQFFRKKPRRIYCTSTNKYLPNSAGAVLICSIRLLWRNDNSRSTELNEVFSFIFKPVTKSCYFQSIFQHDSKPAFEAVQSSAYPAVIFFGYIIGLFDQLDLDTQTAIFKIWYLCRLVGFF